jgi:alkaline phosphatase D
MQIYRSVPYGKLAEFRLLDGRQYRSDQVCGGALSPPCPELDDPSRTMLGSDQERWLLDELGRSKTTWNVLAQQVMMCRGDRDPGPGKLISMDNWNGYDPARRRLFDGVAERGVENLVVLTGDAHCSVAADLRLDLDRPESPTIGSEFIGTSVSSGGDGAVIDTRGYEFLGSNPDMHLYNARRGYVACTVTPDVWRSDFRELPQVTTRGAAIKTVASFAIEAGRPGLQAA